MAYGKLKAPEKNKEEDFESEMLMDEEMDFDMEESEAPENELAEVLASYSKEEIQAYLDSMDSEEDDDEFSEPEMVFGDE